MHEHWTIEWMVYAFDQCTIYIYVQIFRFSRDLYCMRIFSGIILYFCSFYFACIHSIRHLCVCANKSLRNSIPKKNHRNTQGKTKGKYFTHLCFCERVSFSFWVQTSLISLFVPLKKWQFLKVCASFRMKNFSFRFGAMIWNMFFFCITLIHCRKGIQSLWPFRTMSTTERIPILILYVHWYSLTFCYISWIYLNKMSSYKKNTQRHPTTTKTIIMCTNT